MYDPGQAFICFLFAPFRSTFSLLVSPLATPFRHCSVRYTGCQSCRLTRGYRGPGGRLPSACKIIISLRLHIIRVCRRQLCRRPSHRPTRQTVSQPRRLGSRYVKKMPCHACQRHATAGSSCCCRIHSGGYESSMRPLWGACSWGFKREGRIRNAAPSPSGPIPTD